MIIKRNLQLRLLFIVLSSYKPRETTWLAIGDSITYLNNHTDETGNRVTKGYLTSVTGHFPNLHYINKGVNGITSMAYAQHIDKMGLVKADIYTILLGTNDWWQGKPIGIPDDYKKNKGDVSLYGSFRIIIDKLHELNPNAKIVLLTPMQRSDFVYINDFKNNAYGCYKEKNGQSLEQFANAIDSIATFAQISLIDLYHNKSLGINKMVNFKRLKSPDKGEYTNYKYPEFTTIPFNPDKDEYPYPPKAINVTFDGLHPSDKGNKIIAKCIIKIFEPLLN
jgi:lysophospholipase L1-like esterase